MPTKETLDYRSPEWVAEQLGIDKNTVYKFLQDGVLPGLQLGRKWLISESDLAAWLADETQRQTESRRTATNSSHRLSGRLGNMTAPVKQLIKSAHSEARRYNHPKLSQGHFLLAYQEDELLTKRLVALGVDFDEFRHRLESSTPTGEGVASRRLARTDSAKQAIKKAEAIAADRGDRQFTLLDLLLGILEAEDGSAHRYLTEKGIMAELLGKID